MSKIETNIKDSRTSYHFGNRSARNPFDPIYPIRGLEYCKTCKMDVDVLVEVGHADEVDVYRKTCKRCGKVIQYGMGRRHILASASKPLPKKALEFITQIGRDRR